MAHQIHEQLHSTAVSSPPLPHSWCPLTNSTSLLLAVSIQFKHQWYVKLARPSKWGSSCFSTQLITKPSVMNPTPTLPFPHIEVR